MENFKSSVQWSVITLSSSELEKPLETKEPVKSKELGINRLRAAAERLKLSSFSITVELIGKGE